MVNWFHNMDWQKQQEYIRNENMPLFRKLETLYNKKYGVRVGDWIKHKYGTFDRVTYIWRDENDTVFHIQTGGNSLVVIILVGIESIKIINSKSLMQTYHIVVR